MIPLDVLFDILTRLPAKSIGRFRCVSKPWRSLLSQTRFIKAHCHRNKQYPVDECIILLSETYNYMYYLSLNNAHHMFDEITLTTTRLNIAIHPDCFYKGICSCHGLILVRDVEEKYLLVNPTTKMITELPASPTSPTVSDPKRTTYGFGYDSVSDDYKVVTLTSYHGGYDLLVNVYSMRNGTWKKPENESFWGVIVFNPWKGCRYGVYMSGRIHWLAWRVVDHSIVVMVFDLAEEKFWELPLPVGIIPMFYCYQFVVLGKSLCMFDGTVGWVMKEYGVRESWTKFTIVGGEEGDCFRLVCSKGQDEVIMTLNEDTVDEKLVVYNLKEHTFKDVVVHGISPEFYLVAGTFTESIVLPYYSDETVGV